MLEIINILLTTIWTFITVIFEAVIQNLPKLSEIKDFIGSFDTAKIIAYCIGIPISTAPIIAIIIKKIKQKLS